LEAQRIKVTLRHVAIPVVVAIAIIIIAGLSKAVQIFLFTTTYRIFLAPTQI
jgi:hypothetical protein